MAGTEARPTSYLVGSPLFLLDSQRACFLRAKPI